MIFSYFGDRFSSLYADYNFPIVTRLRLGY